MENNRFSLLDEENEAQNTIQEKVREAENIKGSEKKDKSGLRSKAIVGKKNKGKRMGRELQVKIEAKIDKKRKKQSLKSKAKNIY
jgi:hypothetical protein